MTSYGYFAHTSPVLLRNTLKSILDRATFPEEANEFQWSSRENQNEVQGQIYEDMYSSYNGKCIPLLQFIFIYSVTYKSGVAWYELYMVP